MKQPPERRQTETAIIVQSDSHISLFTDVRVCLAVVCMSLCLNRFRLPLAVDMAVLVSILRHPCHQLLHFPNKTEVS